MAGDTTPRMPNTVRTVNDPVHDRAVEITKTWNLGIGEIAMVQQGLEALPDETKGHMAYLAWVLGQEGVEITITHKWEA